MSFAPPVRYYEEVERGLGARYTDAIEEATLRALTSPLSGTAMEPSVRRVLVRGFPYAVVYRPVENGIIVFAVAHLSRTPEYWQHSRL